MNHVENMKIILELFKNKGITLFMDGEKLKYRASHGINHDDIFSTDMQFDKEQRNKSAYKNDCCGDKEMTQKRCAIFIFHFHDLIITDF